MPTWKLDNEGSALMPWMRDDYSWASRGCDDDYRHGRLRPALFLASGIASMVLVVYIVATVWG